MKSSNIVVSIIIPVYNVEKYLPQCLDSVIVQTYSNLDVVIINDGSLDDSDAICQSYAKQDSRIRYISKQNTGLSDTRNLGIKESTGDYLFFLDSDDYLGKDCIQTMVNTAIEGALPIIGFMLDFSDEDRIYKPSQSNGSYDNVDAFLQDFHLYFATKTNFVWGKLYDRDLVVDNHLEFLTDVSLVEDILFNINYYDLIQYKVSVLPECGYYYRQHGGSTLSKKYDSRMFDWNELSYTTTRDFLMRHNAMTEQNSLHFYGNVLGNLLYSTELLCFAKNISFSLKIKLIQYYSRTTLVRDAFTRAIFTSLRSSMEAILMMRFPILYFIYNHAVKYCRTAKNKIKMITQCFTH